MQALLPDDRKGDKHANAAADYHVATNKTGAGINHRCDCRGFLFIACIQNIFGLSLDWTGQHSTGFQTGTSAACSDQPLARLAALLVERVVGPFAKDRAWRGLLKFDDRVHSLSARQEVRRNFKSPVHAGSSR